MCDLEKGFRMIAADCVAGPGPNALKIVYLMKWSILAVASHHPTNKLF
jgi:hypothetical protein